MKEKRDRGQPRKYTPEQLEEIFEKYKQSRKNIKKTMYDNRKKTMREVEINMPLTITSFCVYAGIHRDTLNSYKNEHPEYSDIIKKIYQECESDLIDRALCYENHADFAKHILNNAHGYKDKIEQTTTGTIEVTARQDWQARIAALDEDKREKLLHHMREIKGLLSE